jgi:hypothetical protein
LEITMKLNGLILIGIVLIIATLACSVNGFGPEPAEKILTEEPIDAYPSTGGSEYPAPTQVQPTVEEYPLPGDEPSDMSAVLYPGVDDGGEVLWHQANVMLLNGEVVKVVQTHDLKVSLTLRDGRTLVTIEPAIDDIIKLIETCGEPCTEIVVATE